MGVSVDIGSDNGLAPAWHEAIIWANIENLKYSELDH